MQTSSASVALSLLTHCGSTVGEGGPVNPPVPQKGVDLGGSGPGFTFEPRSTSSNSDHGVLEMGVAVSIRMAEMGTRLRMGGSAPLIPRR